MTWTMIVTPGDREYENVIWLYGYPEAVARALHADAGRESNEAYVSVSSGSDLAQVTGYHRHAMNLARPIASGGRSNFGGMDQHWGDTEEDGYLETGYSQRSRGGRIPIPLREFVRQPNVHVITDVPGAVLP